LLTGAIVFGRATIGQARAAVVADARGPTVRNLFRTQRVRWEDVDRIVPATDDFARYVRVALKHGKRIRCAGLAAGRFENPAKLDPAAQRLQSRLDSEHQPARTTG
jgi:hypothetical protein